MTGSTFPSSSQDVSSAVSSNSYTASDHGRSIPPRPCVTAASGMNGIRHCETRLTSHQGRIVDAPGAATSSSSGTASRASMTSSAVRDRWFAHCSRSTPGRQVHASGDARLGRLQGGMEVLPLPERQGPCAPVTTQSSDESVAERPGRGGVCCEGGREPHPFGSQHLRSRRDDLRRHILHARPPSRSTSRVSARRSPMTLVTDRR